MGFWHGTSLSNEWVLSEVNLTFGSVHGKVKSSTRSAYEKVFRPGSRVHTPIWSTDLVSFFSQQ